jgi:hypothetical protein
MILTTHGIIGGAIGAVIPEYPEAAVGLAFVSHFVADALPHWDYKIFSSSLDPERGGALKMNRLLALDLIRISIDGIAGLFLAWWLFATPTHPWLWFFAAGAGMAPDVLHFLYLRCPKGILKSIEDFHVGIHTNIRITRARIGFTLQCITWVLVYCAVRTIIAS